MITAQATARLHEIISGIIGGDYIKGAILDRARIIADLIVAINLPEHLPDWTSDDAQP